MYKKTFALSALALTISACGGGDSAGSDSVDTVEKPPVIKNIPGTVTVLGNANYEATLTASIVEPDGLINLDNVTYQWQRNSVNIASATASTYAVQKDDIGTSIGLIVKYKDDKGFNEVLTSIPSKKVPLVNFAGNISISGTAQDGKVLQANLEDANTINGEVTYYWYSGDVLLTEQTKATYTLASTDVGKSIYVKAEYTDADGYVEIVLSDNTENILADGIVGGTDYPVGASVEGNNPIQRSTARTNESFEGAGWHAGTLNGFIPGHNASLPRSFSFTQFQNPDAFVAESTITRLGAYSAKLHWKHGDPAKWNGDPNKLDNVDRKAMFHGFSKAGNTATTWYGFSVYFPSDDMIINDSHDPLFFQLHGSPDNTPEGREPGRNPPLALTVTTKSFDVGYGWDARKFATDTGGEGREKINIPINWPDYQDRWVDFVIQIGTNPLEAKGFIKIWINGKQKIDLSNIQVGYNDDKGLYPSWGFYQTGLDNPARTSDAIMYMDEFRQVEAADATYYDVAPGYFAK